MEPDMTKQEKVPASDLKMLFEWNGRDKAGLTGMHELRLCLWQLKIRPSDMDLSDMLEDLLTKSGCDVIQEQQKDSHKGNKGKTDSNVRYPRFTKGHSRPGKVNTEDFIELVETRYLGKYSVEEQLREAFDQFDSDGSGNISPDELRAMLKQMDGFTFTDDEITHFIEVADADGDGEISFEEFYQFMTG